MPRLPVAIAFIALLCLLLKSHASPVPIPALSRAAGAPAGGGTPPLTQGPNQPGGISPSAMEQLLALLKQLASQRHELHGGHVRT